MAIDCHEDSHQTLEYTGKVYKNEGTVEKKPVESNHVEPLQNKKVPWTKLSQVLYKGTATEEREGLATGISFIAQPECENNQEICPSSQDPQRYITHSKQYSLPESFENIPNNVVNSTEGKFAWRTHTGKGTGKKTKRKRSVNRGTCSPPNLVQRIPEEGCRLPIPVQDDESHPYLAHSSIWLADGKKDFSSSTQYSTINEHRNLEDQTPKDVKKDLYKLISPCQFRCHVGANKQLPYLPLENRLDPSSRLPEIVQRLGYDEPFDLGWENLISPKGGSLKLSSPCMDSETHSVEEWTLQALRGSVSMGEPRNLCTMVKAWKDKLEDKDVGDNEGVLLNGEDLKPVDYEYREGVHWEKCGTVLGVGTFGDVFPAKDLKTGFNFAAKKIHVSNFRSEELTCCLSVLSPNITPVYGAIREGCWITVLMHQMKGGSVGQLIKRVGYLQEDRALHYLGQVLDALTHIHAANIVHVDIKADNVLLAEGGDKVYLCDFGHSVHLPHSGSKKQLLTADVVPGTETHMAPEIVRGDPCDVSLDIWSSCCMLLHMLNGWHPWIRTHKRPLCLKIATEPPPLQEIPPDCHTLTHEVISAGLVKEPVGRATAAELRKKVHLALCKIGGLKTPWKSEYREPRSFPTQPTPLIPTEISKDTFPEPQLASPKPRAMPGSPGEEKPGDPPHRSTEEMGSLFDLEIQQLERDLFMESLSHPYSLEDQEHMLHCLSENSMEPKTSKDSGITWDTLSSGVHSWDSQIDPLSFKSDSLLFGGGDTIAPSYFNGVKLQVKKLNGEKLQILESIYTKLGDLAVGISFQIPSPSFTLLTPEGNPIPWNTEMLTCWKELQCSLAPDDGSWIWRVNHGKLEEVFVDNVHSWGGGRPG